MANDESDTLDAEHPAREVLAGASTPVPVVSLGTERTGPFGAPSGDDRHQREEVMDALLIGYARVSTDDRI